jgi:hypothetical protein
MAECYLETAAAQNVNSTRYLKMSAPNRNNGTRHLVPSFLRWLVKAAVRPCNRFRGKVLREESWPPPKLSEGRRMDLRASARKLKKLRNLQGVSPEARFAGYNEEDIWYYLLSKWHVAHMPKIEPGPPIVGS